MDVEKFASKKEWIKSAACRGYATEQQARQYARTKAQLTSDDFILLYEGLKTIGARSRNAYNGLACHGVKSAMGYQHGWKASPTKGNPVPFMDYDEAVG